MDLISPCVGSSSLSAPHPTSASPAHTVQNVMLGCRRASRSSACTLPGGVISYMFRRCSESKARISGPRRSSTRMSRMPLGIDASGRILQEPLADGWHVGLEVPGDGDVEDAG